MMTSMGLMAQETFFHDGLDRSYFLELPDNIEPGAPLVIVLHGYTSGPAVIYSYSGWSAISAAEGVAVCYPEGTLDYFGVPIGMPTWASAIPTTSVSSLHSPNTYKPPII